MQPKKLRIAFAWQTLASENLGVAALAQSQLALAREAAAASGIEIEAVEFCSNGPRIALVKQLGCELADPLSIKKIVLRRSRFLSQLRACDVVMDIGEGDSFSDIYGEKRFFFLSLTKLMALWLKKPLILSPQTIGPFSAGWVKRVAGWVMGRSARVFARDGLSMQVLRDMKVDGNAAEVIDVAFCLPFERKAFPDDGRVRVGVNVSGLLMNGGYTGGNQFGLSVDYRKHVEALIESLLKKDDVEVHLVGHVLADNQAVEDDYAENLRLQARYPQLVVAPKFQSPSEAKSYISGLDFFTGARMHACIAAFSSGVPVMPAAYSRKFAGLFGALGYTHVMDLKTDSTEGATAKVLDAFDRRVALRDEVAQGNQVAQRKLVVYREFLRELFSSLRPAAASA